jgi:2-iminobutanoate/2-iminopropanoate deaminase
MKVIQSQDVARGPLPFSAAVESGGFVFVSGQASVDDRGQIIRGAFEDEMRRSMENLRAVLAAAGLDFRDVVQVRSYVGRREDLAEYNRLYSDYFTPPLPARTTLIGVLSDVLLFEIDAVAKTRETV